MIKYIQTDDTTEQLEITNDTSAGFELPNANPENQQQEMSNSDLMVAFSGRSHNFCVGIVHMCESDIITSNLHRTQIIKYYEIFLNSMSRVLSKYNASILKNAGDSLYYYFPSTVRADKQFGFMSCVECGIELLEIRHEINMYLAKNNLSPLNYRVSTDYGSVVMMKSNTSLTLDMIGSPVSICSKIIQTGPDNEFIVGNELQKIVKVFNDYSFEEMKGYDLPIGYNYQTYSVSRRT
ncbi:MAG: hypothetical protein IIC67_05145 [Thaumarchaeota archaeon]|nr:hypothetical protein [Nitrososphaerota archaeon]